MSLSPDRKLDALGVVLVVLVVLGASLAVFGAMEASESGQEQTPEVNFSTDRINDTHVRVVHAGGDIVRGEELQFNINGREVPSGPFPTSVSEGDAAVVRTDTGYTLHVYWTGGRASPDRLDTLET